MDKADFFFLTAVAAAAVISLLDRISYVDRGDPGSPGFHHRSRPPDRLQTAADVARTQQPAPFLPRLDNVSFPN